MSWPWIPLALATFSLDAFFPSDIQDATKHLDSLVGQSAKSTGPWTAVEMASWRERGYVPDSDDDEEEANKSLQGDPRHDTPTSETTPADNATPSAHPAAVTEDGSLPDVDRGTTAKADSILVGRADNNHPAHLQTNTPNQIAREGHLGLSHVCDVPCSTDAQLEAEIQKGLKAVQDVLGSLPSPFDSDNDSPLSSAPSSTYISPRQSPSRSAQLAVGPETGNATQFAINIHPLPGAWLGPARQRSFRPRAPIQLRPYALEDARYRQTFQARGLRPIRAPEVNANPQQRPLNDESQSTAEYLSSQPDLSEAHVPLSGPVTPSEDPKFRGSGNHESHSQIVQTCEHISLTSADSDEDLPDLANFLRAQRVASAVPRLKKTKPVALPQPRIGKDGFEIYDLPDEDPTTQATIKHNMAQPGAPPSPARSWGGLYSQVGVRADVDVTMADSSPALLPTPMLSSDRHTSKRTFAEIIGISDTEDDVIGLNDDSAASASEASSDDASQGVQHMRRKMKGVLPASWLKLDMKQTQKPARAPRNQGHSLMQGGLEKGIAKYMSSSGKRSREDRLRRADPSVIEVETSSESDVGGPFVDKMSDFKYDLPEAHGEDIVEDNDVDAMLAPRSRTLPVKKRQQRLKDVWSKKKSKSSGQDVFGQRRSTHRRQVSFTGKSTGDARPRKKAKKKQRRPQPTILDAPGFRDNDVPRFLRIASRRIGETTTLRKQDLTKKFFRLATKSDTQDVNQGLRPWDGGRGEVYHIVGRDDELSSRADPLVLQPCGLATLNDGISDTTPYNHRGHFQNTNKPNTQLISLKQATKATLGRIRIHQTRTRSLTGEAVPPIDGRPSALLDFFKSQSLLYSGLQSRLSKRAYQGRPDLEVPVLEERKALSIEKRRPRPARKREDPRARLEARNSSPNISLRAHPKMPDLAM